MGFIGTWFLKDQVGKDSVVTNKNKHRGSLKLSVFCSSQTRVFIQEEQVLQFLKDVFSEAVTKNNYHNHLAQEGTKSIRYYIS